MAVRTASVTGFFDVSATWGGSAPPGTSDTVVINAGIVVTMRNNTTFGTSPVATTDVLTINALGQLIIDGCIATIRGSAMATGDGSGNYGIILRNGGTWRWDSTASGAPTTTHYRLRLSSGHNQFCGMKVEGTSGSWCAMDNVAAGGHGYIHDGGFIGGASPLDLDYFDLNDCGNATNFIIRSWPEPSSQPVELNYVTADGGGKIFGLATTLETSARVILRHVTTRNTVASASATFTRANISGSGAYEITDCNFDKVVELQSAIGLTEARNIYYGLISATEEAINTVSTVNNFYLSTVQGPWILPGSPLNCYFQKDSNNANPHMVQPSSLVGQTIDGCIFDINGTGTVGDMIVMPAPGSIMQYNVIRNILAPNSNGLGPGKFVALLGGANTRVAEDHNTVISTSGGETGGATVGETYLGTAGNITSYKSNLVYRPTGVGSTGYHINRLAASTVPDIVAGANATHNGGFNLAAGSDGNGFNAETGTLCTVAPNANGVSGDPEFVDYTWKLDAWDASLGGPGTHANALTELMKSNDPTGYNPAYNILDGVAFCKTGVRPRSGIYQGTAHDGGDIGAVLVLPFAQLTGTLPDGVTEADMVAGGTTLIITLTNSEWIAA